MKILYDYQIFSKQSRGGISRYYVELMRQFEDNPGVTYNVSLLLSNNLYLDTLRSFSDRRFAAPHTSPDKKFTAVFNKPPCRFLKTFINLQASKRVVAGQDYDVFHPTYFYPYFLKYLKKKPFILTIYDMIHEIYPDYFESSDRIREWKRQLAQKATKIIAISENTRQDIIRFYNIDPEKIEVTHLASSLKAEPPLEKNGHVQPVLSYPYLLFVGKRKLYKNFDFFISSAAPLLKQYPNLKVVCTGGEPISNEERQTFSTLGITGRVIQIFPDDAALGKLYLDAIALVFPSLYEGFGIPVLEAFNCGCPVIASNASSLPEIGGDAALYFNPGDSSSILEALDIIVEDQEIRNECIKRGYQRAKEFSWEKTAKLTERVYKGAI